MIRPRLRWNGSVEMRGKLAMLRRGFPDEIARALYVETEVETTEAKKRTPVDRGHLKASVHTEGPFREGRRVWTMIVAGGVSAPYAIYVHENLEAFHISVKWKAAKLIGTNT